MTWSYPTQAEVQKPFNIDRIVERAKLLKRVVEPAKKPESSAPKYDVVWEPIKGSSQELAITSPAHHTLYCGARGPGKFQPLDEPVLTPKGWKTMGDMKRGSKVLTPSGHYANVTHVYPHPNKEIYLVTFDDGSSTRAGGEHLWKFKSTGHKRKGMSHNWRVDDTDEMKRRLDRGEHVLIPTINPARLEPHPRLKEFAIDPYLLGLWLGDGHVTTRATQYNPIQAVGITSVDDEITNYIAKFGFVKMDELHHNLNKANDSHKFYDGLRDLKLKFCKSDTKFVPKMYLRGTVDVRTSVLQGLMDTDGTCDPKGYCSFTSTSEQLAKDVQYLAWSLGAKSTITGPHPSFCNEERKKDHWDVYIQPAGKFVPFRLGRKINRIQPYMHAELTRRVVSIEHVGKADCACIQLDDLEHLYITKDFVVTHNTITQIMKFRSRVGIGYGSYWRGIIFDREFKNLQDMIAQSKRFFPQFEDGAIWYNGATEYKWTWPTGEELMFRHVKKLEDYDGFHGWEIPFVGWNELTKHPTPDVYDKFMSINRSSFNPEKHTPKRKEGNETVYDTGDGKPLPPIPLEVFSTTNPSGPGHGWVRKRFISPAKYGQLVKRDISYFDPTIGEERKIIRTQVAIFGSFYENPFLDPVYKAGLIESCAREPHLKAAWVDGSWDVTAGGAFDDKWQGRIHIVPRFKVPKSWKVNRTFDWGSTHPFSYGIWAEANGEDVKMEDGSIWTPQRGSLIRIAEIYGVVNGSDGLPDYSQNKGLKLSAKEIALKGKALEKQLMDEGWISKGVQAGPADNQIRDVRESDVETIEQKMAKEGIRFTKSDKSPGSRKVGLQLGRDRMEASVLGEGPGIYVTVNCEASIETIPVLPRNQDDLDDVDTDSIDHCWDDWRYRILQGSNHYATTINTEFPY